VEAVRRNISQGSDIAKLFTGSYLSPDEMTHMPREIAQAAASEGHRHGQLVFAHPSDLQGIRVAIDSGVDVLAHAPDTIGGIDSTLVEELVAHHMKMIPTLKLFSGSSHIDLIRGLPITQARSGRSHQGSLLLHADYTATREGRMIGFVPSLGTLLVPPCPIRIGWTTNSPKQVST